MGNLIFLAILLVSQFIFFTEARSNQEPINIGFVFSLPWDVSNTLRAPVAGPLSIVLTGCMGLIGFAGLVLAPVWWVFGYPKRWYNQHTIPDAVNPEPSKRRSLQDIEMVDNPYFFLSGNISSFAKREQEPTDQGGVAYPDFAQSMFLYIPETEIEQECRKLMVCHAHGFLTFLPERWVRIYRFFGKKILKIPPEYSDAIKKGLEDQGKCMKAYKHCRQDVVTLAKITVLYNLPKTLREFFQNQSK